MFQGVKIKFHAWYRVLCVLRGLYREVTEFLWGVLYELQGYYRGAIFLILSSTFFEISWCFFDTFLLLSKTILGSYEILSRYFPVTFLVLFLYSLLIG